MTHGDMESFLLHTVKDAGEVLMEYFRNGAEPDFKPDRSLVTQADGAAERLIVDRVREAFPDHGVLAEEGSAFNENAEYRWIVDPLDGTSNYAFGHTYFCTSVGLVRGEEVILGAVYNPKSGELFFARRGGGAYLNGNRISVSTTASLEGNLMAVALPRPRHKSDQQWEVLKRLRMEVTLRELGAAALDLCYVAAGRLVGLYNPALYAWDVAAGSLIVEEAGGVVYETTRKHSGAPTGMVLASNRELYGILRELVKG